MRGIDKVIFSTTGYTGSGGCEVYAYNKDAEKLWNAVFEAGAEFGIHNRNEIPQRSPREHILGELESAMSGIELTLIALSIDGYAQASLRYGTW